MLHLWYSYARSFIKVLYCRSTPIGLLQYSYWILQYSLLDYSSTSIGLLQYFYWITPVLLSESIKVLHEGQKDSGIWLPSNSIYYRKQTSRQRDLSVPFVNIIFIFKHAALHDAHEDTRHNDQHGEDAQHNHQHLRHEFPATLGCQRMSLENFRFVRSSISVMAARVMMGCMRTASRPIAIVHFMVVLVWSYPIYNIRCSRMFSYAYCIMLEAMLQRY